MEKTTKRQDIILDFLRKGDSTPTRDIKRYLENKIGELNRATVVRDLNDLLKKDLIVKEGQGRGTYYRSKNENKLLRYFNVENYFRTPPDEREIKNNFDFSIFDHFYNSLFYPRELKELDKLNEDYRRRVSILDLKQLKKELERLTIELSWKSSRIEGNTYSLIDTEILLKENKEARGHSKEEAQMIINHKNALNYVLENKNNFKVINLRKIEDLHKIITDKMDVQTNLRKRAVGITGTSFRPLDNHYKIKEAIEEMAKIINNKNTHPLTKSISSVLLTSYIQPFEDGNKRTARILGNAILLAYDYCPLSYRSIDESDYKKAALLFYEKNSALFFKELFKEQFKFSVKNYFLV